MPEGTLASGRVGHGPREHLAVVRPLIEALFAQAGKTISARSAQRQPKASCAVSRSRPSGSWKYLEPVPGREQVYAGFPPPVHWARGVLTHRFRRTLKGLAVD
jgi:hypothetical protein